MTSSPLQHFLRCSTEAGYDSNHRCRVPLTIWIPLTLHVDLLLRKTVFKRVLASHLVMWALTLLAVLMPAKRRAGKLSLSTYNMDTTHIMDSLPGTFLIRGIDEEFS